MTNGVYTREKKVCQCVTVLRITVVLLLRLIVEIAAVTWEADSSADGEASPFRMPNVDFA